MKKTFAVEDLDCAVCAGKMQDAIAKIPGVISVTVSYMAQKMTVEADEGDFDRIMKEAVKVCRRVEPDCRILGV